MSEQRSGEFFVEFQPVWAHWNKDKLTGVRARNLTQNKPKGSPGNVIVRFRITFPEQAFLRVIPTANIEIPIDHVEAVEVVTEPIITPDPGEENGKGLPSSLEEA